MGDVSAKNLFVMVNMTVLMNLMNTTVGTGLVSVNSSNVLMEKNVSMSVFGYNR